MEILNILTRFPENARTEEVTLSHSSRNGIPASVFRRVPRETEEKEYIRQFRERKRGPFSGETWPGEMVSLVFPLPQSSSSSYSMGDDATNACAMPGYI